MTQPQPQKVMPPLPSIGRPESYYAKLAHEAQKAGDAHAHEAAKVAQYITLGLDPHLDWEEKVKYFRHALKRHCQAPPFPDDDVWMFYHQLANLVRECAGREALKLASNEDDMYAARMAMGQDRAKIEEEAEYFMGHLVGRGEHCPEWFNDEDWVQLKMLRDQWI